MIAVEEVRSALPEAAKDIRLNLQSVLEGGALNDAQKWGVAAACAIAARQPSSSRRRLAGCPRQAGDAVVEDARRPPSSWR
jgi:alkyl hydroperoxide reductase subunit D